MQEIVTIGKNKTGARLAPEMNAEMVEGAEQLTTDNIVTSVSISDLRSDYIVDSHSVGSVAPPAEGATINLALAQLTDKMGERLAFERSSVRLYEAVLTKCRNSKLDLPLARLEEIQQQELEHFLILQTAMEQLGADPTSQTPCADITGVQSMGLFQVVTDPRTNVAQCLNAALTAELTDNAGWELLSRLCEKVGLKELVQQFEKAIKQEAEHLMTIKTLLEQLTMNVQ